MEADWLTQLLDEQDVMVAGQLDSTVSSCVTDGGFGVVSALTDDRNVDTSTESRSLTRRPTRLLVSAVKVESEANIETKEVAQTDVPPTSPPFNPSSCVPVGAAWVMSVAPPKRRQAAARVPATKDIIEATQLSVEVESSSDELLPQRARRAASGWSSRSSTSSLSSRASSAHSLHVKTSAKATAAQSPGGVLAASAASALTLSEVVVGRVCSRSVPAIVQPASHDGVAPASRGHKATALGARPLGARLARKRKASACASTNETQTLSLAMIDRDSCISTTPFPASDALCSSRHSSSESTSAADILADDLSSSGEISNEPLNASMNAKERKILRHNLTERRRVDRLNQRFKRVRAHTRPYTRGTRPAYVTRPHAHSQ